jgi:hypothetical protein
MEDMPAREAINQQAKRMEELMKAVADSARQKHEADQLAVQEKIKTTMIEVQSKIYDKATAYTNLLMIGGYAGSFATWAATRPQLPGKANVAIALSLTTSLTSFVLFEVYKMTFMAVKFMKTRHLLVEPLPPEKFIANLQLAAQNEQKLSLFFMPIWTITMVISVGAALAALTLLFYNYFAFMVGWQGWPQ